MIYSEIDDKGWEVRKVEVFLSKDLGFSNGKNGSYGTFLGELPVPSIADIAANPEFEPHVITCAEFEDIWAQAINSQSNG